MGRVDMGRYTPQAALDRLRGSFARAQRTETSTGTVGFEPTVLHPSIAHIRIGEQSFSPRPILLDPRGFDLLGLEPQDSAFLNRELEELIGIPGWREGLEGKRLGVDFTRAGFGHSIEGAVVAGGLASVAAVPTVFYEAVAVGGEGSVGYQQKMTAHAAMHRGTEPVSYMHELGLMQSWRDQLVGRGVAFTIGLDGQGKEHTGVDLSEVVAFGKLLHKAPWAYKAILGAFNTANYALIDRPFVESVDGFRKTLDIVGGFAAIMATARTSGRWGSNVAKNIALYYPDYGFGRTPRGKISPATPIDFGCSGRVILAPDLISQHILDEYYGAYSINMGENVGLLSSLHSLLEKWKDTQHHRFVLFSTSGHGANAEEIIQSIKDFSEYKQRKNGDSPYGCMVFLGDHKPDGAYQKVNGIFEELKRQDMRVLEARWDKPLEEFVRELENALRNGELVGVTAEDTILTGLLKPLLQRMVHTEGVKPGEAHFMNSSVATVSYLFKPAPPNEPFNGIAAVLKGGSIPRNPSWRQFVTNYLEAQGASKDEIRYELERIPFIDGQPENIFEALDQLYGDMAEEEGGREKGANLVRREALRGLLAVRNATLPAMALAIIQAVRGPLPAAETGVFQERIDEYHMREKVRRMSAVAALFQEDLAELIKTYPELIKDDRVF